MSRARELAEALQRYSRIERGSTLYDSLVLFLDSLAAHEEGAAAGEAEVERARHAVEQAIESLGRYQDTAWLQIELRRADAVLSEHACDKAEMARWKAAAGEDYQRAEKAEARIAAALPLCDDTDETYPLLLARVKEALTK